MLFALLVSLNAGAQVNEFLPEIDVHYKVSPTVRVYFQAKETREARDPIQAEIGPSVEFYLKPLVRLKRVTAFDLDDKNPGRSCFRLDTATCLHPIRRR